MSTQKKSTEQQLNELAIQYNSLSIQLARAQILIEKVKQAISNNGSIDIQIFKKFEAESLAMNSNHPLMIEAEQKIKVILSSSATEENSALNKLGY